MVANFEDKPAKLEFSTIFMEKRLLEICNNIHINSNDSTVKFKVQDSRFKVQDSRFILLQRSFVKEVKRAKKYSICES